jgi:hypothetical protein
VLVKDGKGEFANDESRRTLLFGNVLIGNLEKPLAILTASMLLCVLMADFCPVAAVTVTPEGAPREQEALPEKTLAPSKETPEPENPFEESSRRSSSEAMRRKRETRTIIIILAVLVLLCAYWLTSGRLHHRFPR